VLINKALPDSPGGVTLLARRLQIAKQPLIDQLTELAQLRCGRPSRALRSGGTADPNA
jgi:hypothetical protein